VKFNPARFLTRALTHWTDAPLESRLRSLILFALLSLLWLLLFRHELSRPLPFPPHSDEGFYLSAACDSAGGLILSEKAPMYSLWLRAVCLLNSCVAVRCLFWDRLCSIFLLSLLCSCLGERFFGFRTGVLFGFWIVNSKYIVIEPNGSNRLAAILFVVSLLCLFVPNRHARLPAATLLAFLSSLARPEMRVPLLAILCYIVVREAIALLLHRAHSAAGSWRKEIGYWVLAIGLAASLQAYVTTHGVSDKGLGFTTEDAFTLGFGVTYIERNALSVQYPDAWQAAYEVVGRIMPGVSHPYQALIHFPRHFVDHFVYNFRKCAVVMFSLLFGYCSRSLQLGAFLCYLVAGGLWPGRTAVKQAAKPLSPAQHEQLVVWFSSACLLVPLSCVFLILWRYYLPLIPLGLVGVMFVIRKAQMHLAGFHADKA